MNVADFLVRFEEFAATDISKVQAALTDALLEIDTSVWGLLSDQGQAYLAAHKLALSPFGQGTRLVQKDGTTTYWVHYKRLQGIVSSGYRVA